MLLNFSSDISSWSDLSSRCTWVKEVPRTWDSTLKTRAKFLRSRTFWFETGKAPSKLEQIKHPRSRANWVPLLHVEETTPMKRSSHRSWESMNCVQPVKSPGAYWVCWFFVCSDQHSGLAGLARGLFSVHVHLLLCPVLQILAALTSLTSSLRLLSSVRHWACWYPPTLLYGLKTASRLSPSNQRDHSICFLFAGIIVLPCLLSTGLKLFLTIFCLVFQLRWGCKYSPC